MIPALFASKWTWIIGGAIVGAVVGLGLVDSFGDSRYREGLKDEKARWEQVLQDAQEAQAEAQAQINALTRDLALASAERDRARAQALSQVREELSNAPTIDAQYDVYVNFRRELRAPTASRLDRARADFLSSLPGDGE